MKMKVKISDSNTDQIERYVLMARGSKELSTWSSWNSIYAAPGHAKYELGKILPKKRDWKGAKYRWWSSRPRLSWVEIECFGRTWYIMEIRDDIPWPPEGVKRRQLILTPEQSQKAHDLLAATFIVE